MEGDELDALLIQDFEGVHNIRNGFDVNEVAFPRLELTDGNIISMMIGVNKGRGLVLDAVTDNWFRIMQDDQCKKLQKNGHGNLCNDCMKKLKFCRSLL